MKYYVIIPAHNEESFLESTLKAILAQILPPAMVIVVNDNSSDNTEIIIDNYVAQHPIIRKVNITSSAGHLPGSKVIMAFEAGRKLVGSTYDFLVKLDADIVLPPNYFEMVAAEFRKQPQLGIVGGLAYEQNAAGEWKLNHPMNMDHVRGAFKSYSRECFEAIGGLRNAIGWDTVDELLAAYHGYTTSTLPSLKVKHLRPTGSAYGKQARFLQGQAMYAMRYGFWISCIASLKMAWKQKKISIFFDNLRGYLAAGKQNINYLVSPEEGAFIRNLRWRNIRARLF